MENTKHPTMNGTFYWRASKSGRVFSILDDEYDHNEDYELHERTKYLGDALPNTEMHFPSLKAAESWVSAQD